MADAADAAPTAVEDDVAGAPRPSVSYAQRKESAQRGVPANFIIPSIKYKKDAAPGPEQTAAQWRDQSLMVEVAGKRFSDDDVPRVWRELPRSSTSGGNVRRRGHLLPQRAGCGGRYGARGLHDREENITSRATDAISGCSGSGVGSCREGSCLPCASRRSP